MFYFFSSDVSTVRKLANVTIVPEQTDLTKIIKKKKHMCVWEWCVCVKGGGVIFIG